MVGHTALEVDSGTGLNALYDGLHDQYPIG